MSKNCLPCDNCNIRRGELTAHSKGIACYNNGRWCLISRWGNIFLRKDGKEHYLIDLREREWNHKYKRGNISGFRNYYEAQNKMLMLNKLKQEVGLDGEEAVNIIARVKALAVAEFNNLVQ